MEQSPRFTGFFKSDVSQFCRATALTPVGEIVSVRVEGLIMNMLALGIYSFRIAPEVLDVFYQTIAEGYTPASRLNSLREVVWNKGSDTLSMQLGFRLERLIKSVYMCLVCLVMLFALFLSDSVLEIILNALAIEFVWQIDVEYAKTAFWDIKRRWVKAGAVECRLRATLDLHTLANPRAFCRAYNIHPDCYRSCFDGKMISLRNGRIAMEDALDESFMSEIDVVWHWASTIAKEKNLQNAIWQFSPNLVNFGVVDSLLIRLGWSTHGVFRRFPEYRTWSLWEKVLFLSPVPNKHSSFPQSLPSNEIARRISMNFVPLKSTQEDLQQLTDSGRWSPSDGGDKEKQDRKIGYFDPESFAKQEMNKVEYLNFDPNYHIYSPFERFIFHVFETLRFESLIQSVSVAYEHGKYSSIPFRIFDGLIEWFSYLIQVLFPLMLAGMGAMILACY
jgi:hypothetical protein